MSAFFRDSSPVSRMRLRSAGPYAAIVLAACIGWAGGRVSQAASPPPPGGMVRPIEHLTTPQLQQYEKGKALFQQTFSPATGLGPMFNGSSCLFCHGGAPAMGSGSIEPITLVANAKGVFQLGLPEEGGPNIARHSIAGIPKPSVPCDATVVTTRLTPPVFGDGLLEAVPEPVVLANTGPDPVRKLLGIGGRANRIRGQLGRFGWKSHLATLLDFTVTACSMEMGLSSGYRSLERFPDGTPVDLENLPKKWDPKRPYIEKFFKDKVAMGIPAGKPDLSRQQIEDMAAFQRFLAPPPRASAGVMAHLGEFEFSRVGCAACHVPTLTTGPNALGVPEGVAFHPYTDMLIHDMGPDLSDGIQQSNAGPQDWRTPPLWGLRFRQKLIHDGRAGTIEEAIQVHGGEAARTVQNYNELSDTERGALLEFLKTL